MRGKYVVLEGPDGGGKSTLASYLEEVLVERGVPTQMAGFPSKTGAIGRFVRSSFVGEVAFDRKAYLPLMIADGLDWERRIEEWIAAGGVFIADRHTTFSAFVYQTEDLPEETVTAMFSLFKWRKPDLAVLVDSPVTVMLQRQHARNQRQGRDVVFEQDSVEYNTRIREKYRALFDRYDGPNLTVDGTQTLDTLAQQVIAKLAI